MFYAGTPKNGYDGFCFQGAASKGRCYGVCNDFKIMYMHCTRMICYVDECYEYGFKKSAAIIPCEFGKFNHAVAALYVRNSYGGFDYFEGNNSTFRTFSYPSNICSSRLSLYNMYFNDRNGTDLSFVFKKNSTDKDVKNYVNGKHSSEMFNICYEIAKNY